MASYFTSTFGRKITIVIVCVIALVGMTISSAINSYWGIMAGRLVNAISMGRILRLRCYPSYRYTLEWLTRTFMLIIT